MIWDRKVSFGKTNRVVLWTGDNLKSGCTRGRATLLHPVVVFAKCLYRTLKTKRLIPDAKCNKNFQNSAIIIVVVVTRQTAGCRRHVADRCRTGFYYTTSSRQVSTGSLVRIRIFCNPATKKKKLFQYHNNNNYYYIII